MMLSHHTLLGGAMYVWLEPETDSQDARIVFYDWDDDVGLSLNLDEWRAALDWWGGLDEAKSTLTPPRPSTA